MDQAKQFLKTQIDSITENFIGQGHKQIIIDFSSFSKPEALEFLQQNLHTRLIGVEEEYYNNNKQILEDHSNFEQQFLEVFYNDLMIKDYTSTIISTEEQFARRMTVNQYKTLEFYQHNQSTIKRSCVCGDEEPITLATKLKQHGVGNRPAITFISFQATIDIDNKLDDKFGELCAKIRKAQLQKLAPILQLTLKTQNLSNLFQNAKITLSSFNQLLVENEVDQQYLILSTNIIDLTINYFGNKQMVGDYQNKQHGEQLAYFVLKIFYQSLPPNFGAIFFSFDRTFIECKKVFNFISAFKNLNNLITCPLGVILQAKNFDEVAKSYSIVQRQQSATITINQTLKIFQDCFAGSYKNESEREILQPVQIGSLNSKN